MEKQIKFLIEKCIKMLTNVRIATKCTSHGNFGKSASAPSPNPEKCVCAAKNVTGNLNFKNKKN